MYITIELPDANNRKVKPKAYGKVTFFATTRKEKTHSELDFYLYDTVNVEESKIIVGFRNIIYIVKKRKRNGGNSC